MKRMGAKREDTEDSKDSENEGKDKSRGHSVYLCIWIGVEPLFFICSDVQTKALAPQKEKNY